MRRARIDKKVRSEQKISKLDKLTRVRHRNSRRYRRYSRTLSHHVKERTNAGLRFIADNERPKTNTAIIKNRKKNDLPHFENRL